MYDNLRIADAPDGRKVHVMFMAFKPGAPTLCRCVGKDNWMLVEPAGDGFVRRWNTVTSANYLERLADDTLSFRVAAKPLGSATLKAALGIGPWVVVRLSEDGRTMELVGSYDLPPKERGVKLWGEKEKA